MPAPGAYNNSMTHFEIRRRILQALYERYRSDPYGSTSLPDLRKALGGQDEEFTWNFAYLLDKGLIRKIDGFDNAGYYEHAKITVEGIDLIEKAGEFERVFPREES
jgi:hypothetical protein